MEASPLASTWEVYPQLSKQQFQAARGNGIDPVLAQILHNRGLKTSTEMQAFMLPDYQQTRNPLLLIDMQRAVDRIERALKNHEHITVYGDYDADGVTSSSLLFRALRRLKHPDAQLDFHIPHRLKDGCGLHLRTLDMLKARGTSLIVTTDCASSDVEQVEYARSLGIDVIITDHHHPPPERPQAVAMVNPWRPDCTYGERYLCGAGIAFKLVQALYRAYGLSTEDEMDLLDLVAIGTIADIAPLLGENHMLVHLGLQRLNNTKKPGLQALIRLARQQQTTRIRERDVAFGLAPRLNAAGRMKEASIAFRLLTTDDPQTASDLADELEQLNILRQQQTEELMRSVRTNALEQPDLPIIMASGNDWHEGIIGLVAGKLAEEINKTVIVVSKDPHTGLSRGSARGHKDFNIIAALRSFNGHFERYGGHAQAAGFTIRQEHLDDLYEHLLREYHQGGLQAPAIEGTDIPDPTGVVTEQESIETIAPLTPKMVDLTMTKSELISYQLYKQLRQLAPFGAGNPEPVFRMENIYLLDKWTSGYNRQNLRLRLGFPNSNLQHIGTFVRGARELPRLQNVTRINVIFRIESAENESRPEIWLKILDVEPAQAGS